MNKQTTLRIKAETMDTARILLPIVQVDYPGVLLTASDVLRMAIDQGLELLEDSFEKTDKDLMSLNREVR